MRWSIRTLLFIYRLSYFHLILYLWKLKRTADFTLDHAHRGGQAKLLSVMASLQLCGAFYWWLMNTYYCGDPRTKSQPQDTKHKGLKLLTFVTCQFLMT